MDKPIICKLHSVLLSALRQPRALAGKSALLVAVSGGADSVALLHALRCVQAQLGISLHVASLDHGIRGEAGQRDLAFVAALAAEWRLSCSLDAVDVPQLAREWQVGIEAAARRARYDFLAQVARRLNIAGVAVAHHADDQAETQLMHIARGSGLRGLRGMRRVTTLPGHADIRLLRPLLGFSRAEIEAYCAQFKLAFCTDESNSDARYRRNFIRSEIIPRLQELNPAVVGALQRLGESAAVDDDFVWQQYDQTVQSKIHKSTARWRIGKSDYFSFHAALRRRFLLDAVEKQAAGAAGLTHDRVVELDGWTRDAGVGACRDIGGGLRLRCDYDTLVVETSAARPEPGRYRLIPQATDIKLDVGQTLSLSGINLRVAPAMKLEEHLSLQLPARAELRLRTRRRGEYFKPKGMHGRSRKLKDWMIDRKIPRMLRDQIPLLCADDAIVAICLADTWQLAELNPPVVVPHVCVLLD